MPHTYAFVDPLFSTGIAWGLRAVERLALCFELAIHHRRVPEARDLAKYGALLEREADQIDRLVAGAYEAMAHFDLFTAQAMLYFVTVSYAEVTQRLAPDEGVAWRGFLGVGDQTLEPLPWESLGRLRRITGRRDCVGAPDERRDFASWIAGVTAPRNVAGLADPARNNLYPVDLDVLIERHALLGLRRAEVLAALPALRGMAMRDEDRSISPPGRRSPTPETPAPQ
jgi:FADH2 O2-dependent halogenase